MSTSPETTNDDPTRRTGLAHLPLELLRKVVKELAGRRDLQTFALLCRSTTLPAREALFDTLELSNRLTPEYLLFGKSRVNPFPALARRLVVFREGDMLSLSPIDLAMVLHELPNARTLDISGQVQITMPQVQSAFHTCFRMIDRLKYEPPEGDYSHESLRVLLDHCRNLTQLDLGTDFVTLRDPVTPWHFAPRRTVAVVPSLVELPKLRRLTLRSPLYLSFTSLDIVSLKSLQGIRYLDLDFTEESVGRTWPSGSEFPLDFFTSFTTGGAGIGQDDDCSSSSSSSSSSIEHVSFNFPLYSKRSDVDSLRGVLSRLERLRTLSIGSISSGAASILLGGLPVTCRDVFIESGKDGSPDWMALARFFLEHEGENELAVALGGRRIWMDRSDCKFCDENFQRETEERCRRLGIELIVPGGQGTRRAEVGSKTLSF